MEKKEIIKKYSNGNFNIVWKPSVCIHAGICAKSLPKVYNPSIRPWIKAENASIEELKAQIDECPSGALSYEVIGEESAESETQATKVEISANGPLLVTGTLNVTDSEGITTVNSNKTAFCRCGASGNKPYCDGSHNKINFVG